VNPLNAVISSRTTAEIVSLLFAASYRPLHVREIARRCGLSEAVMRRELGRLARLGLVEAHRDGNRLCYRARMAHPLASDLRSMVDKSVGIVAALRTVLREPRVDLAFAHGPDVARITEFGCPIRLLVVGTITRSKTERLLGLAAFGLGRRIELDLISPRELARLHARGDANLPSPRVFVIGTERQLAAALARAERGGNLNIGVFLGEKSQGRRKSRT
jgi:DNA-binding transcriptional ArsR family regulator